MSLLDIDERLVELAEVVEFHKTPLVDRKRFSERCALGLVEGGCANAENVEVLRSFREHCDLLVSVGDCATMGGLPAMRNGISPEECLNEAYRDGPSTTNPSGALPDDPELPLLLDRVYPCHEVVHIDHLLPGCPPSADAFWVAIQALLAGRDPDLPRPLLRYD
jgi:NAD-reducing hydrogenase small subunit